MSVVNAEARFARRARLGNRAEGILHARGDMPVRLRSGWAGALEDCNFQELIVAILLEAVEREIATVCVESVWFDDRSGAELCALLDGDKLEEANLELPCNSLELDLDGWLYVVSYAQQ